MPVCRHTHTHTHTTLKCFFKTVVVLILFLLLRSWIYVIVYPLGTNVNTFETFPYFINISVQTIFTDWLHSVLGPSFRDLFHWQHQLQTRRYWMIVYIFQRPHCTVYDPWQLAEHCCLTVPSPPQVICTDIDSHHLDGLFFMHLKVFTPNSSKSILKTKHSSLVWREKCKIDIDVSLCVE